MKISNLGVLEIAEHEGVVLGPYLDSVGVWTYGVGHTAAAGGLIPEKMGRVDTRGWSEARVREELIAALGLFDKDLDSYEARVNSAVTVPLKQYQFDALSSFDFNTGGIYKAKLTESLNRGKYKEAAEGFMGWTRPKEIITRRTAEMRLFQTGDYTANGSMIAVYDALGDGKIRWRARINSGQLATLMQMAGAKRSPFVMAVSKAWGFVKSAFKSLKG
jgi:lysozyme